MTTFLIRRLALSCVVLWGVITLSFVLTALAPGDMAEAMVGQRTDAETLTRIRSKLGVDQDPVTRYCLYMKAILQGDWGISVRYGEPVWNLILQRFPKTVLLAISAILFSATCGVLLGVIAGITQGSLLDRLISQFTLAGISAPVFWIGLILVWLFSLQLGWLPPSGYEQGELRYLILPALTLGIRSVALITRISRAAIIETGSTHFLRTARAKGLSPFQIYGKHALRNAALPIITVIGLDLGSYLSGSVLTEKVFAWPGLGRLLVDAILARDTALINASVAFMAGLYILVNMGIDLCYGILDPRIRIRET
jgi:peptide/nickel transport system permease protein